MSNLATCRGPLVERRRREHGVRELNTTRYNVAEGQLHIHARFLRVGNAAGLVLLAKKRSMTLTASWLESRGLRLFEGYVEFDLS